MAPVPRVGLVPALLTTLGLGLCLAGVALVAAGTREATTVLVGASIVGVFFCSGAWTVGFAASRAPSMALLVALMTYTLQVVLLAVVFVALDRSGVLVGQDRGWLAVTVIVGALAWTAALVAHALRSVPRNDEGGLEGAGRASDEEGVGW